MGAHAYQFATGPARLRSGTVHAHVDLTAEARGQDYKENTNSTQNKSQTHHAKQYEVTSFVSTDCELSTETCSKTVYSLGP